MIGDLETLKFEQTGRVLTVRIDHPPRNLFDEFLGADLATLTKALQSDDSIGAVIFTGAPERTFVTRYDTAELLRDGTSVGWQLSFRTARILIALTRGLRRIPGVEPLLRRTTAKGVLNLHRVNDAFRRMHRMDKGFIAAINGMAVGGGLLLPLSCDFRLVADDAGPIGLPEASIGFLGGIGGTQRTLRFIGASRTADIMLSGRHLTVEEAEAIGLVNEVVPRKELLDSARKRAEQLAALSPEALAANKRLAYGTELRSYNQATRLEEAMLLATLSTPAAEQLLAAYTNRLGTPGEVDEDQVEAYRRAVEGTLTSGQGDSTVSSAQAAACR